MGEGAIRKLMNRELELQLVLQNAVDNGQLAGAAAAVWRDGGMQTACAGWRDVESHLPIERDTIFRIASMTKPIISVAALMLVDESRMALNDAISEYAPEFSQMRIAPSCRHLFLIHLRTPITLNFHLGHPRTGGRWAANCTKKANQTSIKSHLVDLRCSALIRGQNSPIAAV
jgi:hypothetical protein